MAETGASETCQVVHAALKCHQHNGQMPKQIWGFPKIGGPNTVPNTVGSLLYYKEPKIRYSFLIFRNSHLGSREAG